jgi:hypothetical protein
MIDREVVVVVMRNEGGGHEHEDRHSPRGDGLQASADRSYPDSLRTFSCCPTPTSSETFASRFDLRPAQREQEK